MGALLLGDREFRIMNRQPKSSPFAEKRPCDLPVLEVIGTEPWIEVLATGSRREHGHTGLFPRDWLLRSVL